LAKSQIYALIAENQAERNQTLKTLDEEINLTRERQQYSFWDKLASVVTLGLYSMVKEMYDKLEIEALQEAKKEIRIERLAELQQLREIRNALKDASDRAYSGNKWYIPEDRFNNLANLLKSSRMLDDRTKTGLTTYLEVMQDIEKNRIQEKNHSKILEKANENILIGNNGTHYDSYAEKRLNGLKDLAKDMLQTKGLSEEDRKFCEKLTNLTPDSERVLKEKLEKPNAFKNFDALKTIVNNLQEKQKESQQNIQVTQITVQHSQTGTPDQRKQEQVLQGRPVGNQAQKSAVVTPVGNQPAQATPTQNVNAIKQNNVENQIATLQKQKQQLENSAYYTGKEVRIGKHNMQILDLQSTQAQPKNPIKKVISKQNVAEEGNIRETPKVTSMTRQANGIIIRKDSNGRIDVLNQEKASQMAKQALKEQGHDKNGDNIDDRNQVSLSDIKLDVSHSRKASSVQGDSGKIQQKGIV
jgi:hypothetical protein